MDLRRHLLRIWNLWLPFLGSGIRVRSISPDFRHIVVDLKKRPWTLNYVGTQYGGSMYSMTDPFYMIMLIRNLGPEYVVWDKGATIRFLKPGRTRLTAEFEIGEEDLASIRAEVDRGGKTDWKRTVRVRDAEGTVVAEVDKVVYIRKKRPLSEPMTE